MAIVEAKDSNVLVLENNSFRIYRKIQNKIYYEKKEYCFVYEFDSSDEVQQEIDWYQMQNIRVCCLHENSKHQLYVRR